MSPAALTIRVLRPAALQLESDQSLGVPGFGKQYKDFVIRWLTASVWALAALLACHYPVTIAGISFDWLIVPCTLGGLVLGPVGATVFCSGAVAYLLLITGLSPDIDPLLGALQAIIISQLAQRMPSVLAASIVSVGLWVIAAQLGGREIAQAGFSGIVAIGAVALWTYAAPRLTRSARGNSLQQRLLATNMAVAVGVASLVLFSFFVSTVISATRESESRLRRTLDLADMTLESFLSDHIQVLQTTSTLLSRVHHRDDVWPLLNLVRDQYDGFISLLLANAQGTLEIVAFSGDRSRDQEIALQSEGVADRHYFIGALSSEEPYISPGFQGRGIGNDILVAVSQQVTSGERIWVLEGSITLGRLAAVIDNAVDPSIELVVLDQDGRVLFSRNNAFDLLKPLPSTVSKSSAFSHMRAVSPASWQIYVRDRADLEDFAARVSKSTLLLIILATLSILYIVITQSHRLARYFGDILSGIENPGPSNLRIARSAPDEFRNLLTEINTLMRKSEMNAMPALPKTVAVSKQSSVSLPEQPSARAWATYQVGHLDPALDFLLCATLDQMGLRKTSIGIADLYFGVDPGEATVGDIAVGFGENQDALLLPATGSAIVTHVSGLLNEEPVLDRSLLDEMKQIRPNDAQRLFSKIAREGLEQLAEIMLDNSRPVTSRDLHKLKGKFASVGANQLAFELNILDKATGDDHASHDRQLARVRIAGWLLSLMPDLKPGLDQSVHEASKRTP